MQRVFAQTKPRYLRFWPIILTLLSGLVYFRFSSEIAKQIYATKSIYSPTVFAYYNYLVEAFLNGRTYLASANTYDLSLFNNHWYLYSGPAPVLFVLPFYILFGLAASDIIYTLIAGTANVFLFSWLLTEWQKLSGRHFSPLASTLTIISYAFISPNFWLSLTGNIWFTAQVITQFYLLLFLVFFLLFMRKKMWWWLVLAVVFFNLAWLSRYTNIFYFLLFFYPWLAGIRHFGKRHALSYLTIIFSLTLFFMLLFFIYNYVRFANPLETGFRFVTGATRYDMYLKKGQMFALSLLPHNLQYYFFNHLMLFIHKPYAQFDIEGNSLFSVYPVVGLLIFLVQPGISLIRGFNRRETSDNKMELYAFGLLAAVVTVLIMGSLLTYIATGWAQFGVRYFLDVVPLVYLACFIAMRYSPGIITVILVAYGLLVNAVGILVYYHLI